MTSVLESRLTMSMDTSLYDLLDDGCMVVKNTDVEHDRLTLGVCTATNPFCSRLHENHTIFVLCKIKAKQLHNHTVYKVDWLAKTDTSDIQTSNPVS